MGDQKHANEGDTMKKIDLKNLTVHPTGVWLDTWMLLCAGTLESHNAMTVSWGSIGGMWNKPFVQVVVRPSRYTYEFIEQFDTFTVSSFPEQYKAALGVLGSQSGRDGNKIARFGLTPCPSLAVAAPSFKEACLTFECRKMYYQDFEPAHFLQHDIHDLYPGNTNHHRAYFGEIMAVTTADA
mgnify:CR=1 FL=1